ncbi:MAG: glycogen debranching protein GlgX [Deltaproteobacteria bacterium]|jgi:glycogen operon protein|nr:glycogen debranching protein GlgX [Deltaproteobacteria bacterium]
MKKVSLAPKWSFEITPGSPLLPGATIIPEGINFAVFSRHSKKLWLVLFTATGTCIGEIELDPVHNKTGDIWHVLLRTRKHDLQYCFRTNGPHDPKGTGLFFDDKTLLLDPYARALAGGEKWNGPPRKQAGFKRRCLVIEDRFDWEGDRPLQIPLQDSIIYEMHVRGFTQHPSSNVKNPGTFAGIIEKIPYLQDLGITAVELMPVAEFNENENTNINPVTGQELVNFWGYSPITFCAPKASYAADNKGGNQVREFKEMVKALHKAGIEVILDVVFNHTAEGGSDGPMLSFRGLDNTVYYLLDPETKEYLNFTGCGNTLNCNHPIVRQHIIACLHFWVIEMHVDGFRFDLAAILGRDMKGEPLSNPPMVEMIAEDPILSKTKLIAEAWDAAGLYQVGSFSTSGRWAEWNGRFRDDVRAFMCGHEGMVAPVATRIAGSSDLFQKSLRRPYNSINFVTSHDGFTLADLVSYNTKHNLENGEDNRDGFDHNISWNSGHEGRTDKVAIKKLRARRMRSLALILMLSQGVPMILAGDEFGRTQKGNNNAYCHDSHLSWIDWTFKERNTDLFRFFRLLIALRKKHPVFRRSDFFPDLPHKLHHPIRWYSTHPDTMDWSAGARSLAFLLDGHGAEDRPDDDFFIMLNSHTLKAETFAAPKPRNNRIWRKIIDTAAPPPLDIMEESKGLLLASPKKIKVEPMAAVVLISASK